MNIQNICDYLEDIGIIDNETLNTFLSIYSLTTQHIPYNSKYYNNKHTRQANSFSTFSSVLCTFMKHILSIEDNFLKKFTQNTTIKQYNTLTHLFRIISTHHTIAISNAFNRIKYHNINYNAKVNAHHYNRNCESGHVKRARSVKGGVNVNKSFSVAPCNSYNFNNCAWYNVGNCMKKRDAISVKSMLNKREKTLMSKLKKEHNIKFKQQGSKMNMHKYSNSALNKSYNSNYQIGYKKMNLLEEVNLNDNEGYREGRLIEIDGGDYDYEYEYNEYGNKDDKGKREWDYYGTGGQVPKSTKVGKMYDTEIYSLRMSDNY